MPSQVPVNDLTRAAEREGQGLIRVIEDVVASGWYIQGPNVRGFEEEFAGYLGVAACVGVGNGTDALELALRTLGMGPGSRVATTANAGFYASSATMAVGAEPVYIEADQESMLMDVAALEGALVQGLDCVVLTHLYGDASAAPGVARLCHAHGVPLIEDCAQSAGALVEGSRAGSFGDLATFSFYPTKNLGALGDGGVVASRSAELAAVAREIAQYGWATRYDVRRPGRNSRLDELQAAVLRYRLPHLDALNEGRREICLAYVDSLGDGPLSLRFHATPTEHVAHLAVVRTTRVDEVRKLLGLRGIRTDVHYPIPDHEQALWNGRRAHELPVTSTLCREILTIPCFPELTQDEVDRVGRALVEASETLGSTP